MLSGSVAWIDLVADEHEMRNSRGDFIMRIRYLRGEPGLRADAIEGPNGEIAIR